MAVHGGHGRKVIAAGRTDRDQAGQEAIKIPVIGNAAGRRMQPNNVTGCHAVKAAVFWAIWLLRRTVHF